MESRKQVVEAVFMSVLDYGDVIYKNATACSLKALDSVYHSALRFITGDGYSTHHCVLYSKVGWSSLTERRQNHWYLFIYKGIVGKLPGYISDMLVWNSGPYQTRSNDCLMLKVPRFHSELGKSAFSYGAPTSWNKLQCKIKMNSTLSYNQFRSLIKNLPMSICTCFK